MYSAGDLNIELNAKFADDEEIIDIDAVIESVIERNREDEEFIGYWLRRALDHEARKKQREFKVSAEREEPRQLALPLQGYRYIQRRYSCERGGRRLSIPILKMTRAECWAHRTAVHKNALGNAAHRDEWDRFIAENFAAPQYEAAE